MRFCHLCQRWLLKSDLCGGGGERWTLVLISDSFLLEDLYPVRGEGGFYSRLYKSVTPRAACFKIRFMNCRIFSSHSSVGVVSLDNTQRSTPPPPVILPNQINLIQLLYRKYYFQYSNYNTLI